MRRREFIRLIGGAAAAWPIAARAQQSKDTPTVGVLWHAGSAGEEDVYLSVRVKALNDLGYVFVASQSYETTDPTVEPQILSVQGSGANVLLTAATPKFAAQAIRKVYDIGWKPTHFLSYVSISVGAVMHPPGLKRGSASSRRDSSKTLLINSGRTPPNMRNG
jgi:branched-chain amino acid transport system substrate-binding protein